MPFWCFQKSHDAFQKSQIKLDCHHSTEWFWCVCWCSFSFGSLVALHLLSSILLWLWCEGIGCVSMLFLSALILNFFASSSQRMLSYPQRSSFWWSFSSSSHWKVHFHLVSVSIFCMPKAVSQFGVVAVFTFVFSDKDSTVHNALQTTWKSKKDSKLPQKQDCTRIILTSNNNIVLGHVSHGACAHIAQSFWSQIAVAIRDDLTHVQTKVEWSLVAKLLFFTPFHSSFF